MKIVRQLAELSTISQGPMRGAALAIGNFDGLHGGHRVVIDAARTEAAAHAGPLAVMTFEPHPRSVFRPQDPVFRLTPEAMKLRILEGLGVDLVVVIPFDKEFSAKTAGDFVQGILVEALAVRHVVTGFDFHFGHRREGSPEYLRKAGQEAGFGVTIIGALETDEGEPVSSSLIREALAKGDLEKASAQLGYRPTFEGRIIHGEKRGRELGYPTANMQLHPAATVRHGVYTVRMLVDGVIHEGVASFGRRPQFDNGAPLFETFLFDFDGDLYDRIVEVELVEYLRPEASFSSLDDLIAQMNKDSEAARSTHAAMETAPFGPDALTPASNV